MTKFEILIPVVIFICLTGGITIWTVVSNYQESVQVCLKMRNKPADCERFK